MYLQLTQMEQAFKDLKGDLGVRPVYHQKDDRIEAHIMVCFLACCVHVTLRAKLQRHAPGMTPRQVLDHLGKMQMTHFEYPVTRMAQTVADWARVYPPKPVTKYCEPRWVEGDSVGQASTQEAVAS